MGHNLRNEIISNFTNAWNDMFPILRAIFVRYLQEITTASLESRCVYAQQFHILVVVSYLHWNQINDCQRPLQESRTIQIGSYYCLCVVCGLCAQMHATQQFSVCRRNVPIHTYEHVWTRKKHPTIAAIHCRRVIERQIQHSLRAYVRLRKLFRWSFRMARDMSKLLYVDWPSFR